MIQIVVRAEHGIDLTGFQAQLRELPGQRLRLLLDRLLERQHAHHVVEIVASVEHIATVGVLYEHAVAGKPKLATGAAIPKSVKAIDHERPTVEQMNLGVGHEANPLILAAPPPRSSSHAPRAHPKLA